MTDTGPVPIYKNDLKYKSQRKKYLPKDIKFVYDISDSAQEIIDSEIDLDTIDSRLSDMIENIDEVTKNEDNVTISKTVILDFSHMNLETLRYPKEINLLTHIDLSNNNLKHIPSLKFSNIEIFDCGSNKLTQLPSI